MSELIKGTAFTLWIKSCEKPARNPSVERGKAPHLGTATQAEASCPQWPCLILHSTFATSKPKIRVPPHVRSVNPTKSHSSSAFHFRFVQGLLLTWGRMWEHTPLSYSGSCAQLLRYSHVLELLLLHVKNTQLALPFYFSSSWESNKCNSSCYLTLLFDLYFTCKKWILPWEVVTSPWCVTPSAALYSAVSDLMTLPGFPSPGLQTGSGELLRQQAVSWLEHFILGLRRGHSLLLTAIVSFGTCFPGSVCLHLPLLISRTTRGPEDRHLVLYQTAASPPAAL